MPNIVEEQDSTIRQKIDNKTELLSVTTGDVGRSIYDSFILAALFSETIIGKTYPKGWPARDGAFNLYIAKIDNVSSDVNNATNWQLVGSGANKQVWDLAMGSFPSNAYEVINPSITSYKTDDIYIATPDLPNTGACTAEINSLGALPIKKASGSSYVDLIAGDFSATSYLLYRGAYFLLVGGAGEGSGGVSTFSALTDSPYDNILLAEALDSKQDKPNGVLTGCTITLGSYGGGGSNNDIRVTEGTWRISPSEYSNVGSGNTDFLDIALSASGLQRYVELVGTGLNTIIKVEGAENAIAVRPTLGIGQVSLGSILVKDALIDPPVPDLSGYVPLVGTPSMTGNIKSSNSFFQLGLNDDTSYIQFINTLLTLKSEVGNFSSETKNESFTDGRYTIIVNDSGGVGRRRTLEIRSNQPAVFSGDVIAYNTNRTTEIDANGGALINRDYADAHYLGAGTTNLGYTPSPTNGIVTSDTGTDATLTLVDGTNSGLVSPSMKNTWDSKQNTMSIASDAEMQTGTDNVKYTTALRIATWWTWIKTQAQTIAGLWTFSGGITISGGRLLFTNTFTAGGDSWYRQASNVLRAAINGTDRLEINTSGVKTKGTHTFENTIFTNLAPTVKKIGTVQTTGELTADYTATTFFQGIQRNLTTLVSSTTETAIFNPEIGSTLMPLSLMFLGSQWLYTIPFKLSTTGTVRFLVRFGEAATALASRTIIADTGTFSPAVTAQGGVLKVMFSIGTVGASGTAVLVCSIECQINGKTPVMTVPLRTSSGVSTLVDNLLEITCLFGTSSASDRIDVEMGNSFKLS